MNHGVKTLSFSELAIGTRDCISVAVTEQDIDRFAQLSGDVAPLHTDREFARHQGFDGRVAHGLLIGAYISRLLGNNLPGANGILQQLELSFRNPLVPPETLMIDGVIESASASVRQIVIKVNVTNTNGRLVAVAKAKCIIKDSH